MGPVTNYIQPMDDDEEEYKENDNMKKSTEGILKIAHYLALNDKNLRGNQVICLMWL